MQRAIFEIPESYKTVVTTILDNQPVTYSIKNLPGSTNLELEITYVKMQSFIIDGIEQDLNAYMASL